MDRKTTINVDTLDILSETTTTQRRIRIGDDKNLEIFHNETSGSTIETDGNLTVKGNIIPSAHDTFDIGTPELRFSDIYLTGGTIWLGDQHKLGVLNGDIRLSRRTLNTLPAVVEAVRGGDSEADIVIIINNKFGANTVNGISNMKLEHILYYYQLKTGDSTKTLKDIYSDDSNTAEADFSKDYGVGGGAMTATGTFTASSGILLSPGDAPADTDNKLYNQNGTLKFDGSNVGGGGGGGASSLDDLNDVKYEGTNFTDSLMIGSTSTGTLSSALRNTAVGKGVIASITSGDNNTCVGYNAGNSLTTGSNNICIGHEADSSSATVSNEITLGDSSVTTLRCGATTIASLSDRRDKTNIEDSQYGVDFVNKLRPVKFTWRTRHGSSKDGSESLGFIAQEFQDAMDNGENSFMDLVYENNSERLEAKYGNLIPILTKAIQDLSADNRELRETVQRIQRQVNQL